MPLRRPGGDLIDVYVREQPDGSYVVSDLGESIGFLVSMGYDPRDGTNSAFLLGNIGHQHGVELDKGRGLLRAHVATATDVAPAVQRIADASLAISYLLYMAPRHQH